MAACDTKFTLYHRVEKMLYGSKCVHRQGEAVQTSLLAIWSCTILCYPQATRTEWKPWEMNREGGRE